MPKQDIGHVRLDWLTVLFKPEAAVFHELINEKSLCIICRTDV